MDHGGDVTVEQTSHLLFDEGTGGITPLGVEQERGLPEVTGRMEQIEDHGDVGRCRPWRAERRPVVRGPVELVRIVVVAQGVSYSGAGGENR